MFFSSRPDGIEFGTQRRFHVLPTPPISASCGPPPAAAEDEERMKPLPTPPTRQEEVFSAQALRLKGTCLALAKKAEHRRPPAASAARYPGFIAADTISTSQPPPPAARRGMGHSAKVWSNVTVMVLILGECCVPLKPRPTITFLARLTSGQRLPGFWRDRGAELHLGQEDRTTCKWGSNLG